jgi:VanZ family protein
MLPLKYPKFWLTAGWLLVALSIVGSVLPVDPAAPVFQFDKLVHAGTYALLMIWFAGIYRPGRYTIIAICLVLLGLVLEGVQALLPLRFFDVADLVANMSGVAAGLVLTLLLLKGWCQRVEAWITRD